MSSSSCSQNSGIWQNLRQKRKSQDQDSEFWENCTNTTTHAFPVPQSGPDTSDDLCRECIGNLAGSSSCRRSSGHFHSSPLSLPRQHSHFPQLSQQMPTTAPIPRQRTIMTMTTPTTTPVSQHSITPAVIPLDYDYQMMAPAPFTHLRHNSLAASHHTTSGAGSTTAATSRLDLDVDMIDNNQYSLFGDPVPPIPSADHLLESHFSGSNMFRQSTSIEITSSEEEGFGRTVTLDADRTTGTTSMRLFPNVPYTSSFSHRRISNATNGMAIPRLEPPDIQILPNSSGNSSSEHVESPNYSLLTPDDILRRQSNLDAAEAADVSTVVEKITISDGNGTREYSEATRRVSNFSEDFKSNVGSLSDFPMTELPIAAAPFSRKQSHESYSSSEWFRPIGQHFPEFTKMPRLRPSSRKVMSIKRDELRQSPVEAMINDSNGSSSGEERILDTTQVLEHPTVSLDGLLPERPPDPSPARLRSIIENDYHAERRKSDEVVLPPPPAAPPPESYLPSPEDDLEDVRSLKRAMSPAIIRDSIPTGGHYRVDEARLHKKTSFTIITDKSPQASRASTPMSQIHLRQSPSRKPPSSHYANEHLTTSSSSAKPLAKPRYHLPQGSQAAAHLKLPDIQQHSGLLTDDSPRPSVQFNIAGSPYSPMKFPQKGILHQRDSITSSVDTLPPPSSGPIPKSRRRSSMLPSTELSYKNKMRSCEMLPLITDPYRSAIPRFHRSSSDLQKEKAVFPPGALPRPLKPNPNPTRHQRGLLRIINNEDNFSNIPLELNWASMDDVRVGKFRKPSLSPLTLEKRRRSSSTSPERRSSTQTFSDRRSSNLSTITTSDFSYRRPSQMSLGQRRKSSILPMSSSILAKRRQSIVPSGQHPATILRSRTARAKIAKPTTLSPIIGTPNKDRSTQQSPADTTTQSLMTDTPSDITARRDSLSKIPVSRSTSRQSTRDPEIRLSFRDESRANSRGESRLSLRGDSRMSSLPPSRTSSQPGSRINSRPSSRIPSRSSTPRRLSTVGLPLSGSTSRAPSSHRSISRRQSLSPGNLMGSNSSGRKKDPKKQLDQRRESQTRIPMRAKSDLVRRKSSVTSPKKSKLPLSAKKSSPKRASAKQRLETASAKRTPITTRKSNINVKKASSAMDKKTLTSKSQPMSTPKIGAASSLKRETSSLKKKTVESKSNDKNIKRSVTSLSVKNSKSTSPNGTKFQTSGRKGTGANKSAKRDPSVTSGKKVNTGADGKSKRQSSSKTANPEEPQGASKASEAVERTSEDVKASATAAVASAAASAADGVAGVGAAKAASASKTGNLKRQASRLSLIRMGSKMSLTGKSRSGSNLSKKVQGDVAIKENDNASEKTGNSVSAKAAALTKVNSTGQLIMPDGTVTLPASILEKSQKTLENVQKTVTDATDEIQKTINENLTDLKSLGSDMGRMTDSAPSPTPSVATVVENRVAKPGESVSRSGTAEGAAKVSSTSGDDQHGQPQGVGMVVSSQAQKSPLPPSQPVEASVSVVNLNADGSGAVSGMTTAEGGGAVIDATERNYELGIDDKPTGGASVEAVSVDGMVGSAAREGSGDDFKADSVKRHSPDGQGGSLIGSAKGSGSRELLEEKEDSESPTGCCRCCARFCMPCRRMRCSRCCRRNKRATKDESEQPVLSATSSATTTHLEVIDERGPSGGGSIHSTAAEAKTSCWQRLNCCRRCRKQKTTTVADEEMAQAAAQTNLEAPTSNEMNDAEEMGSAQPKQGKCGLCLSKVFCCRSVNRVEATTGDETVVKKCCFCIPCRRKRTVASAVGGASTRSSVAWQDPEQGITATDASVVEGADAATPRPGCCKRFWSKLLCCRKKPTPKVSESRRASMRAPPPPSEDTRRKLHIDLVEYTSKMKGAIPVLPLYLAWFCAMCNTVLPGLGTLLSGFFCICVGIPRFSQYDSAKARVGSFIINVIVAVSQLFCVLFCCVGWGWSIWWGTIMLKCARKLKKIRKVERLEMEEEQRQAEAAAAAAVIAAKVAKT